MPKKPIPHRPIANSKSRSRTSPIYQEAYGAASTLGAHARRLNVGHQTLADWLAGLYPIPETKKQAVMDILQRQATAITLLANRLSTKPVTLDKSASHLIEYRHARDNGLGTLSKPL